MSQALLGKKIGMTSIYSQDGKVENVTVIEAGPCPVLAVGEKYVQIGFDTVKESRLKKPLLGYFKKLKCAPLKKLAQVLKAPGREYAVGEALKADLFNVGEYVDVVGTSKGRGFQGGMRRWNWSGGPQTHGSMSHRRVGSVGSTTTPGRVWKGHHMAGHMGNSGMTALNLRVVKVDAENNIIMVRGGVSGPKNGYVVIRKSRKRVSKAAAALPQKKKK